MSLKVFIDTNIFLNSFLNRDKDISKSVLKFLEKQDIGLFLNDISIINISYILKKEFSKDEIREIIDILINEHSVVCASGKIIEDANSSKFGDFEDGVQYYCAKKVDADLIITDNKNDFKISDIEIVSAKEFYQLYVV